MQRLSNPMKNIFVFILIITSFSLFAQDVDLTTEKTDTVVKYKPTYLDYKIISHSNDTTIIDTTLTMQKDYKFNYIRKDDFELMAFSNQGQQFNYLGYDFGSTGYLPKFGMDAKHFNYREVEDIKYYRVPTPSSELMWRTGLNQGQTLDAFITANLSPRLNLMIGYNGLRSLGKYRYTLSAHKNFRTSFNYTTKNDRYHVRGHFTSHNIENQENGGLTEQSVMLFESGDSDFTDRGRLDVNFNDAVNILEGKRYHLNHAFKLLTDRSENPTELSIGHEFNYETKHYFYSQTANTLLGDAFSEKIFDHSGLKTMKNDITATLNTPYILGTINAKVGQYNYNHYYQGVVHLNNQTVDQKLSGNAYDIGAGWNGTLKNFHVNGSFETIVGGDIKGHNFFAEASYLNSKIFDLSARISEVFKLPDFAFIHKQSDYVEYNWQNKNFFNEKIRNLGFSFKSAKILDAELEINQIDNYTYFDISSKPQQYSGVVNYLKLKVFKGFTVGKFSLDNTIMYQNVSNGNEVFRVPEFVTRNSLYFTDYLFKNDPMYLQTGITFKYFSAYQMNAYNPLLADFTLSNEEYGDFPLFDVFVNARVQRMRMYFKLENVTAALTGRNYYSAPLHPYRDFTVRFGIVWNFFI